MSQVPTEQCDHSIQETGHDCQVVYACVCVETCLRLRGDLERDLLCCHGDRLRLFSGGEEEGLRVLDLDLDFDPE